MDSYSYSYSYSGAAGTRTRNRTVCSRIEYEYEYHFIEYEYDSRRLLKLDALFRRHPLENNEIAAYRLPQIRQRQNDPTLILTTMFNQYYVRASTNSSSFHILQSIAKSFNKF